MKGRYIQVNQYILSCCSTADMPESFFEKRQIPYVCFHVQIGDRSYPDDLGKSLNPEYYYEQIALGEKPVTSQVNVEEYIRFWEPYLQEGKDIFHVSLSSGISGTFNSACVARDQLKDMYPDRKIFVMDSLAASSGYGLLMTLLADERDRGKTIQELYDWGMDNRLCIQHWFFSSDLTSYFRGGRISRTAFTFGKILNLCPLMNVDKYGKLVPRQKVRTKQRVIQEIVSKMEKYADNGLEYDNICYICQSACRKDAEAVADLIRGKFRKIKGEIRITTIGSVIGAHTGPGTVALFFAGTKRE